MLSPAQKVVDPTAVIAGAGGIGFTVKTIAELVAVFGLEQTRFDNMTHVTVAPLGKEVEENVGALEPEFTPFTFHWNAGAEPPFAGVDENVKRFPVHDGLLPPVTVTNTDGDKIELTVIVIAGLVATVELAHGEFEFKMQVTASPLFNVLVVNVGLLFPTLMPFIFH